MSNQPDSFLTIAHQVIEDEIQELRNLDAALDENFSTACRMILDCCGRVIFSGVGHSGHVAEKSAANLASLTRPSFFLHAGEAAHGDLGAVSGDDLVLFISNSGETEEILRLLPRMRSIGAKTIAIVGNLQSSMAQTCDLALSHGAREEAGPIKYAGSSTALNCMALCDALVMATSVAKGMTEEAYWHVHPGGAVGSRLGAKFNHSKS